MDAQSEEIGRRLGELADDPAARGSRVAACEAITEGLLNVGQLLWVSGNLLGPDRAAGASPCGFGDDETVGVATVAQIGGQLARGVTQLLAASNLYAAAALVRQLLEVEYLAFAFAEQHKIAADWLRADHKTRLAFWSPKQLRKRAPGRFLPSDYSHHCELGGHPTSRGLSLLPDHEVLNEAYLWTDAAGHLRSVWLHVRVSAERVTGGPLLESCDVGDVDRSIEAWLAADGLYVALQDLGAIRARSAAGGKTRAAGSG